MNGKIKKTVATKMAAVMRGIYTLATVVGIVMAVISAIGILATYFLSVFDTNSWFVSNARDIIVALAAAIVAGLAMSGLGEWHRQFHSKNERDLALRFLKVTHRILIQIWQFNMPERLHSEEGISDEREVRLGRKKALAETMGELPGPEQAEAKAYWGKDAVRGKLQPLVKCCRKTFHNLDSKNLQELPGRPDPFVGEDELSKEAEKAYKDIEEWLLPKLKR